MRTEFGKTLGGFTHNPWLPGSLGWFSDEKRRAFIFSLDMQEKFVPTSDQLILSDDGYGPVFGGNEVCDIFIGDDCNNYEREAFCGFPSCYNRAGGNKLELSQESLRLFSGATDGHMFRVE